ncbi:ubiquitin-conjugating enzyme E2Q-like protein 1 isoform X1 [Prorops nasuta]|uniref:ubiquitin-conjugating enzyme E2Q-like protein 1 isoform X1 n=1 Tax=Prorops nasuta TaxID=863751 RepID=UPI0034CFB3CC
MTSKPKDKVVAAIKKFFRASEKISDKDGASSSSGSPPRRILTLHHRPDVITPAEDSLESPGTSQTGHSNFFFKSKKHGNTGIQPDSTSQFRSKNNCRLPIKINKDTVVSRTSRSTISTMEAANKVVDRGVRLRRLMKELTEIQRLQHEPFSIFTVELVNDNLFEWHVKLHKIDFESPLAQDMRDMKIPYILLHLAFPDNFPFAPPFMRVVSPRIEKGYVMDGGAICMELLTPKGWASAYNIEAVIMQFAASVVKGHGRVVRMPKTTKEFNKRIAEESFKFLVKTHEKYGWVTPPLSEG